MLHFYHPSHFHHSLHPLYHYILSIIISHFTSISVSLHQSSLFILSIMISHFYHPSLFPITHCILYNITSKFSPSLSHSSITLHTSPPLFASFIISLVHFLTLPSTHCILSQHFPLLSSHHPSRFPTLFPSSSRFLWDIF